jgi:hypothetical protein
MKTIYAFSLLVFITVTPMLAASADDAGRGSPAPGTAQDGSRPADGAIKGGAMLPGESGGVQNPSGAPADPVSRACADLTGTLRAECLSRQRDAARGGSKPPEVVNPRADPTAPPPQNPH